MNWLAFYLLASLHPVVFVLIARVDITWTRRILLWMAMLIPGTLYCWDYFAIKKEHERMCAAESGLRVYIQPEKMDRVRVVGDVYEFSPKSLLDRYYPKLKIVEALTEKKDPSTGRPLQYYEAYTAEPNPKAGEWINGSPQEGKYLYRSTRLDEIDPDMYELSKKEYEIPNGSKSELILSKNGKMYAKDVELLHGWTGIRYPDAFPTWRCPIETGRPPENNSEAPLDRWIYPPNKLARIPNLIFEKP